ncbi:26S proteasome non-ATPase regulatory subunit 6-like [Chrysoperla carnea]|uniref:26S proteasome non-ATPase regulatory subunit 6-like n=1 Tax=Chrysoperla carnea TaxID=189513 RepID=UPI001D061825|nr:26S proteasome non-ATPase regulatory subunit 6-like [Chrysoperla carnea]
MNMDSVIVDSEEVKSIESVNLELQSFDDLIQSYLKTLAIPVEPANPENCESTPDYMKVARLKFFISLNDSYIDTENVRRQLMNLIELNNMLPYYENCCEYFKWPVDEKLVAKMKANIDTQIIELDKYEKNEENTSYAWKKRLDFYLKIGDYEKAYQWAYEKSEDSTFSTNSRLEATFALFRIAYCDNCNVAAMGKSVEKAKHFIDSAEHKADWTGRNKFKAYEGLYGLAVRDYKRASMNLTDCVSTFESYELTDFNKIVKFTVIASMIALPRCDIRKKIVNYGLIMQELNYPQCEHLKEFVLSFNECRYGDFLRILAVTELVLRFEPLTYPHYRQYIREMKLKAYAQMLQSYSIVSLKRMAEIFGVTSDYIENDVSTFTASGKLTCRIDKVAGKIITANAGIAYDRSLTYQNCIKRGDFLLNRIKRIARIIES